MQIKVGDTLQDARDRKKVLQIDRVNRCDDTGRVTSLTARPCENFVWGHPVQIETSKVFSRNENPGDGYFHIPKTGADGKEALSQDEKKMEATIARYEISDKDAEWLRSLVS